MALYGQPSYSTVKRAVNEEDEKQVPSKKNVDPAMATAIKKRLKARTDENESLKKAKQSY